MAVVVFHRPGVTPYVNSQVAVEKANVLMVEPAGYLGADAKVTMVNGTVVGVTESFDEVVQALS